MAHLTREKRLQLMMPVLYSLELQILECLISISPIQQTANEWGTDKNAAIFIHSMLIRVGSVLAPCWFPVDPCWFSVDPCWFRVNPCYICVDPCCSVLAPWSNRVFRVGSMLTSCWRCSLTCSSVLAPCALRVDKSSCYFLGNSRSFSCRITPDCLKRSSATIRDDPCETAFIRLSVWLGLNASSIMKKNVPLW